MKLLTSTWFGSSKEWSVKVSFKQSFNIKVVQVAQIPKTLTNLRLMKLKIPNEQPAIGCQPAFGSHSQSLKNKLFSSFFFMRLTWASRAHDHIRPCEHMRKHAFAGWNTQQTQLNILFYFVLCLKDIFFPWKIILFGQVEAISSKKRFYYIL